MVKLANTYLFFDSSSTVENKKLCEYRAI